jgi:putative ABC transport system permease protein
LGGDAGHYAVLSYALWQNLFHGDPHVPGKTLSLGNADYQVLGVMPAGFTTDTYLALQRPDLWIPLQLKIDPTDIANDYCVIARLKPGVSLERARQDLNGVTQRFRNVYGSKLIDRNESIGVISYRDFIINDAKRPLWILLGAVAFVLLLACANVANLLLARSAARQHEMAIRVAVGATGAQLVRQLLTESLILSLAGAALGCLVGNVFLPALLHLAPAGIPLLAGARIDNRVLLFILSIAVLTGIAFGLFPAIQSAWLGIANPLRQAGKRTTMTAASRRLRHALVAAEIAVSLLLLVGASLLIKSMANLESVPAGLDANNVLTMQMSLDDRFDSSNAVAAMVTSVTTRLEAMPGVTSAATTNMLPMWPYFDLPFEIMGRPTSRENMPDELYRFASWDYFSTLRVPVIAGRTFSERDNAGSAPVVIVNEAFAHKYFPRQNPLGRQILIGRIMGPNFADKPRQIVGIVGDIHDAGLGETAPPEMFAPEAQVPDGLMNLDRQLAPLNWVIRTAGDPMALAERIRRETLAASGGIPMAEPRPLSAILSDSVARQRFLMTLLSIFAGIALLLGTVGLYGVISYSVAQRTREMGIRSAMGARRADLLKLVVGEGMRLVAAGVVIGLGAAFALTRFLQSALYGVAPSDPAVLAAVTFLMASIALVACFIPALRASRVDPLIALREE